MDNANRKSRLLTFLRCDHLHLLSFEGFFKTYCNVFLLCSHVTFLSTEGECLHLKRNQHKATIVLVVPSLYMWHIHLNECFLMFSGLQYLVHVNKGKFDKYDKLSYSVSSDFYFATLLFNCLNAPHLGLCPRGTDSPFQAPVCMCVCARTHRSKDTPGLEKHTAPMVTPT